MDPEDALSAIYVYLNQRRKATRAGEVAAMNVLLDRLARAGVDWGGLHRLIFQRAPRSQSFRLDVARTAIEGFIRARVPVLGEPQPDARTYQKTATYHRPRPVAMY